MLLVRVHGRLVNRVPSPQFPSVSLLLQSEDEFGLPPTPPHPTRLRGPSTLLSHLPLHSQQPSRTPNLLIPIGGIHMIQPRSSLPVYSLVCSPPAASADPPAASSRRNNTGALKEALSSSRAAAGTLSRRPRSCLGTVRDRNVYIQSPPGPGEAPSSQTQL